jgi:2-dehydropantoate 2-reductase
MGSLFACALAGAGHQVSVLCRREAQAQIISEQGLAVSAPGSGLRAFRPVATTDPELIGRADLVLVCCKSYDTPGAAVALPALTGPGSVVLTLQNGLGNVETLRGAAEGIVVLAGVTHQGAYVSAPGRVDHAGTGETIVGNPGAAADSRARAVAATLEAAGMQCSVSDNILGVQWAKLLTNAAINPLTAILRVPNGALLDLPGALVVAQAAVQEGEAVAGAECVDLPSAGDQLWEAIVETARRTAANRSSMLQDLLHGRRTEIDSINGAIVAAGARAGVPTPVNSTLACLVRALETMDRNHGQPALVKALSPKRGH